ncbi:hypothetical protein THAOC_23961, partial [Thalassiosira oceanica]
VRPSPSMSATGGMHRRWIRACMGEEIRPEVELFFRWSSNGSLPTVVALQFASKNLQERRVWRPSQSRGPINHRTFADAIPPRYGPSNGDRAAHEPSPTSHVTRVKAGATRLAPGDLWEPQKAYRSRNLTRIQVNHEPSEGGHGCSAPD